MDLNGHAPLARRVGQAVLLRPAASGHDRIDELQVAGVKGQREVDGPAIAGPIAVIAEVVLHVAGRLLLRLVVFKFTEDESRALSDDVRQHVQPAPMGHADDDLLDALAGGVGDGQVEQGNEALGAFERKALGPDELFMDEFLEHHGVGKACEYSKLLVARKP